MQKSETVTEIVQW